MLIKNTYILMDKFKAAETILPGQFVSINSNGAVLSKPTTWTIGLAGDTIDGIVDIFHAGGKFASNQYEPDPIAPWTPGTNLYVSANSLLTPDNLSEQQVVATLITAPDSNFVEFIINV